LITKDGAFTGYGAVFGNVDSHKDVIERGAFSTSLSRWRARGKWPAMRLMHGDNGANPFRFDDLPVGRWTEMREDARGLWVSGQLVGFQETEIGRRLYALMSSPGGLLDGLSIGFRAVRSRPGSGAVKRYLEEIDLRELSLVTDPSNDNARVAPLSQAEAAADRLRDALAAAVAAEAKPKQADSDPLEKLKAALSRMA
jgi:HK97 family phage prohead protease